MSDRNGGRPNILVVMTDQHAAHFAGTYGHPFIATPGMDRLAREGEMNPNLIYLDTRKRPIDCIIM